jgi:CheY-like chemotaxis protein
MRPSHKLWAIPQRVAVPNRPVGLERVRDHPPHAIVLDYHLPRLAGRQFTARYRATAVPPAPMLFMTAAQHRTSVAPKCGQTAA